MVRLTRIYTRTGDNGETGLGNGQRVPKHDLRVSAYGTVDEANSVIGVARLHIPPDRPDADAMLAHVQNDLFDLGADLCTPESEDEEEGTRLRIVMSQVTRLEREIDAMNASLKSLSSFILPGGSPAAAHIHHARAVVRRAERLICELGTYEYVNPAALKYTNRLSDHLFVMSRHLNRDGAGDVLWAPGATR
jgi:cob(I)alamin adenosyltransferase